MESPTWKILMVDDDEDDYILTRQMLSGSKHAKYSLDWANSYPDGWMKIQAGGYHAVLIDYDLGAYNGLDLIRNAVAIDCPFPLILFTGRGSYEVDLHAMQAGAALYLTKSEVNPLLLERGIRYAIERKRDQMLLVQNDEALKKANEELKQELYKRAQAEEERKEKSRKLQAALERQQLLSEAGAELLAGADPIERLDDFFKRISHSLGLEVYVQYNLSADGTYLELGQVGGIPPRYQTVLRRLELGQAVCGTVAQTRQPMYVNDIQQSRDSKVRLIRSIGLGTYACHPLIVNGQLLGTLSFGSRKLNQFDAETIDLLKTFCNMVANALARKRTEEALRRERELLQKLFERIPVMITMYRPDLHMFQFNPKFEELIGWTTEDARQADFDLMERFYPDPQYRHMVADYMRSLQEGWRDFEVTTKDGEVLDSSWTNFRLLDDTQIGIGIDIGERKQAERRLRELAQTLDADRAKLAAVLENLPVGVLIADKTGHITDVNKQADRIWAGDAPSVAQIDRYQDANAGFAKQGRLLLPEEYPRIKALTSGQPVGPDELDIRRLDGTTGTVMVSAAPIKDRDGLLAGAVSVIVDITERKRTEEALRVEQATLQGILNATKESIWLFDPSGIILLANDTAISRFKRPPEEILGKHHSLFMPAELAQYRQEYLRQVVETKQPVEFEDQRAGFNFHHSFYPVLDANGCVTGVVSFSRDITERKQAQADLERYAHRLEQSNRDLEDFAFIASHDMQEPLRKIRSFAGELQSKAGPMLGAEERDYLDRLCRAAERMESMLHGLLEYSRLTTSAQPQGTVDLARVAADVLQDMELQIQRSGAQVDVGDLPVIEAEPTQMRQLLQNLISNALKFSRPGVPPQVKVSSRLLEPHSPVQSGMVEIRVEDNGIGFDPQLVGTLFQPFHRLVGRSEYEGSGMGLTICCKIVDRHGGNITAQSQPGQGSTFIVELPVSQPS